MPLKHDQSTLLYIDEVDDEEVDDEEVDDYCC